MCQALNQGARGKKNDIKTQFLSLRRLTLIWFLFCDRHRAEYFTHIISISLQNDTKLITLSIFYK